MRRRLGILAVVLALLLGSVSPAMAAKAPYCYVALGDSIAAGYRLTNPAAYSYPARLAGMIGATGTANLARPGMASAEVLAQLADPQVAAQVAEADLITVSAGCADLLSVLTGTIAQAAGTLDIDAIMADPQKLAAVGAALQSPAVQDTFAQAIGSAGMALAGIDQALRQINPDAKVIYTGGYNPYAAFQLPGFDLAALSGTLIGGLNRAMVQALPNATIVDVEKLFSAPGAPQCVNAVLADMDPHPNAVGHALIASAIQKLVSASFPAVRYPARAAVTTARLAVYRSASAKSAKLETLPAGASLLVYRWNDEWARIGRDKGYAYVKLSGLAMSDLLEKPLYRTQVVSGKITIRSAPSAAAPAVAKSVRGNQFVAFSVSGKWAKVQYKGVIGYVEAKHLKKV